MQRYQSADKRQLLEDLTASTLVTFRPLQRGYTKIIDIGRKTKTDGKLTVFVLSNIYENCRHSRFEPRSVFYGIKITVEHGKITFHFHFHFYFSRGYSRLPDAETSFAWNLKLTVLGFSLFHHFSVSFAVDNFRISSL